MDIALLVFLFICPLLIDLDMQRAFRQSSLYVLLLVPQIQASAFKPFWHGYAGFDTQEHDL